MKKFKLVFIICIILFITGCEVKYDLEFNNGIIKEDIDIILSSDEVTEDNIEKMKYSLQNEAYAISKQWIQEKYNVDYEEGKNEYIGKLSYEYTTGNFSDANLITQCYDLFSFVKADDGYALVTSDLFKCGVFSYLPVDKYNITITTDYIVNDHNADLVDGNKYTWVIDTNGRTEIKKPIKISFSSNTKSDVLKENLRENSNNILLLIFSGLFLVIVVIYIIYYIKSKKNGD